MGMKYYIGTEGTEVALAAATAKSVLQVLAATNIPLKVVAWGIYFDGVSVTGEPVNVQWRRATTTGTGTAVTERKHDPDQSGTPQGAGLKNLTAQGTLDYLFESREVHPQMGFELWYPLGREIPVPSGGRLELQATAPAAVNCQAWMLCEE